MGERRFHPSYERQKKVNALYDYAVPTWLTNVLHIGATGSLYAGGAFIALMQFVDPDDQSIDGAVQIVLSWLHSHRFVIVAVLVLADVLLRSSLWIARKWRRLEIRKLREILDCLVHEIFPERDLEKHNYRATLFKVRRCYFCGSWLGIVARSGHTHTRRTTIFSIDANHLNHNTGFAGECWRQGATIISRSPLPDTRSENATSDEIEAYKTQGYLSDAEYDGMGVRSRVFLGTCVRVGGRPWGILVLDSTDASLNLNSRTSKQEAVLRVAAVAISQMVSRGGRSEP